jgi:hypothetical protein
VPSIGNTVGAALTMPSINLSATSNQLVLQSSGVTGTLTWTPTSSNKTITFPDATGTVALTGTTDPQVFLGDLILNGTGSSTTTPRKIGINNWASGNAARYTFGDDWNALQNAYGGRMQLTAYHTIDLSGNRQTTSGLGFVVPPNDDASVNVIGTLPAYPVLTVIAAGSQTANLQEWRNSSGTALATVNSSGNLSTKHLIGFAGTPSIGSWGGGAGTTSGTSIAGKDLGGSITFTAGGTPNAGQRIVTVQFNTAYGSAPSAVILSAGATQSGSDINKVYVTNITTTSFDIYATSAAAISTGSHKFYFIVVE